MFGQRFRLKIATIATAVTDGKATAFRIPAGAEIVVIEKLRVYSQDRNRQIKVEWNDQIVKMFAVDIEDHADPVQATNKEFWKVPKGHLGIPPCNFVAWALVQIRNAVMIRRLAGG